MIWHEMSRSGGGEPLIALYSYVVQYIILECSGRGAQKMMEAASARSEQFPIWEVLPILERK